MRPDNSLVMPGEALGSWDLAGAAGKRCWSARPSASDLQSNRMAALLSSPGIDGTPCLQDPLTMYQSQYKRAHCRPFSSR